MHARAGYAEFAGGAALNISAQKSDAGRTGAHKRFGKAADPSLDLVDQMAQFHAATGLRVGEGCTKRRNPEQRCAVCPPLWPRGHRNGVGYPLDAIRTGGRRPTLCGAEESYTLHGQLSNCEGSFQDSKGIVNGTGEAGQGTLEAGQRPSPDSEAGGPCRDSDTDVT